MLAHASCVAIWSAANRRRARCVAPLGGVATSKGVFSRNADRVHSRAPRRARRADESEGHQAIRAETHGAGAHHRRPALPGPTRPHVATPDLFEPRRDEPQRRDARRRAPRPRLHGGPGSSRLRRHLPGHHRAGRGARGADQHGGFSYAQPVPRQRHRRSRHGIHAASRRGDGRRPDGALRHLRARAPQQARLGAAGVPGDQERARAHRRERRGGRHAKSARHDGAHQPRARRSAPRLRNHETPAHPPSRAHRRRRGRRSRWRPESMASRCT